MITTVTLNPCIDRTWEVRAFRVGRYNRILASREEIAGKGINVSVALKQLGQNTRCVALQPGGDSRIPALLDPLGIPHELVPIPGAVRVNTKIFDVENQELTECNLPGDPVAAEDLASLLVRYGESLGTSRLVVFSGSVPPGIPENIYRTMVEMAREAGVRAVLDASGPYLSQGIQARPYLLKPNREELEYLRGEPVSSVTQAASAARELVERGVAMVCVSLGAEGALLASESGVHYSPGCPIQVRGVQGAGDSLVAGLCIGLLDRLPQGELLRMAVAVAHGSLMREGTQMCRRKDLDKMLDSIPIEPL